ncbi:phenoloxidase 3-like [Planococcus citri]|uniref:phenoloxidase 3-like n=1 Tax=Planococcus citri TaxID=170843 RepID=UPI0031F9BF7D
MMTTISQDQTELLDIVSLLQTPAPENVAEPTFVTQQQPEPISETQPPGTLRTTTKKSIAKSYVVADSFKTEDEAPPIKTQFEEAISLASLLPKESRLEVFNSFHQKCASHLINVFYNVPLNHFKQAVEYAQTRVNISLMNYALSVALLHRKDSIKFNLQLPSHLTTEPGMYLDMAKIKEDLGKSKRTEEKSGELKRCFVEINPNFTGTNLDPEHRVAYFREDIGINLHHRHWHEVYPYDADISIVNKDRRGELFYYMHQQIVARYNFERFSSGLSRAEAYSDFRDPVEEAYFPKMDQLSKSNQFCSRPANTILKDLHRDNFYIKLSTMERWRDRIYDAIDRGYAYTIDPNTHQEILKKIDAVTGINELGNTVEAVEKLSWNYKYYGDMHNKGHLFFSYVHDPDNRFRENGSVMSHSETALRDPIFYRWHVFIDDIFQQYKRTLLPYTVDERQFTGITVESVKISPDLQPNNDSSNKQVQCVAIEQTKILPAESKLPNNENNNVNNVLKTFWEKDAVDITHGLLNQDASKTKEQIYAVFTHLQHENFQYEIKVTNTRSHNVTGTVRIFLAPHQDESGLQMTFNGQRRMFVEMDKFTVELKSNVTSIIKRKSTHSSVTIPFERSFMTLSAAKKFVQSQLPDKKLTESANGYCGCGWPHHLLVGKGTVGGLLCDLFVMITDYEDDKVSDSPLDEVCCDKSSLSYCGIRNKKYPDRKPMGFPFDRDIPNVNATINDFITEKQEDNEKKNKPLAPPLSNMKVVQVKVVHTEDEPKLGKSLAKINYKEELAKQCI